MDVPDHRRLGRQLKIFATDDACGAGPAFMAARGCHSALRNRALYRRPGATLRVPARVYTGNGQTRVVRAFGPLGPLPRRHVPTDGRWDRTSRHCAQ